MVDIYDFIKEFAKIDIQAQDVHGKAYLLKSYIKRLDEDSILVEPPIYKGKSFNLNDGEKINIGIHADDGVYLGESEVIGKELSDTSGILITYPTYTQQIQRREYLRVPLNLEAEMIFHLESSGIRKKTDKIRLKDISGSGFSYISSTPIEQYYDIECKINLDNEYITSRCEHIYTKESSIHNEAKFIHAFIFVDMSPRDIEKIIKASFKYQVEMRKKGF